MRPEPLWRASASQWKKGFQGGGDQLREEGYDVDSLAIVESMDPENGTIGIPLLIFSVRSNDYKRGCNS